MKSTDLAIIADILEELRMRWRGDLRHANLANVNSFLSFRLRQQVPDFDRKRFIAHIQIKLN